MPFDRDAYVHQYAPPGSELAAAWRASPPDAGEIEETFLSPLCESAANTWFLANSDLYLEAVRAQPPAEREESLAILSTRLMEAADYATLAENELADHFAASLAGFADLCAEVRPAATDEWPGDRPDDWQLQSVAELRLTLLAVLYGDLPLARLILRSDEEIRCGSPTCGDPESAECPTCGETVAPRDSHARWTR